VVSSSSGSGLKGPNRIHRSTPVAVKSMASMARELRGRPIVSVEGHAGQIPASRGRTGLFRGV
jgi:hypothetical protein